MRTFLLLALTLLFSFSFAQTRFISNDYSDYYDWFHQRSQIAEMYSFGTQLYVFEQDVKVYQQPDFQAKPVAALLQGQTVTNLSNYATSYRAIEGEYRGYGDLWYKVKGTDPTGRAFQGYIFGVFLAKGWRQADLVGDQRSELIMLGVATQTNKDPNNISAEIRIIQDGHLYHSVRVPGLCLFEDCGSSSLLRIIKNKPHQGMVIIEASTLAVGCFAGIEKSFFHWNGRQLDRVFHAEFTTGEQYVNKSFTFTKSDRSTFACKYSHEDEYYNPVWSSVVTKPASRASRKLPAAGTLLASAGWE